MIVTPRVMLNRSKAIAACVAAIVILRVAALTTEGTVIRIWIVGSPYNDATPKVPGPLLHLREESGRLGYGIAIETFPARGFAATFADAVARNAAPDVVVFDNFGVMDGITTTLGRFDGIGQDPTRRSQFMKVTGAFDELLGPARGWTYLFALSPQHAAARTLALRRPECPTGAAGSVAQRELGRAVAAVATAYLQGDAIGVQAYADQDRLPGVQLQKGATKVGGMSSCGVWANNKLAIATVTAAYEMDTALGDARVLMVFRRPADRWQLLVVTRDPVATGEFVREVPRLVAQLSTDAHSGALPIPATLISPVTQDFPRPHRGERFGVFTWQSSTSDDVIGEIAEFGYADDERLFVVPPRHGGRSEISAGALWTTRREWSWRVWSISRSGELVFTESRTFVH